LKFILTIDTEADNQWNHGIPLTTRNIRNIPRFQELSEKYSIKPTYLVTSEICEDPYSKNIFNSYLKKRTIEIGAHLHVWTTPPFEDFDGLRFNDKYHAFASELNKCLLDKKIEKLTSQIKENFGIQPKSFRSGRFGFDSTCADLLVKYGYLVDSSVTPNINWSQHKGLPNGKGGPNFVGFPNKHNYLISEGKKLLEVPVTILPTKWPFTFNQNALELYINSEDSLLKKIFRRMVFGEQPVWLRPYPWIDIKILKNIVSRAQKGSLEFITMMFHSSEIMEGCSPYRKNKKEIEIFFSLLDKFFIFLNEQNIESIFLSDTVNYI
jgi:hypothetical protein